MLRLAAILVMIATSAYAESVDVADRGPVNLAPLTCRTNPNDSFVKRVCYDAKERYLLIQLNKAWYHYCNVDRATYDALDADPHKGTFYAHHIKGSRQDGPFDCRTHHAPAYGRP